MTQQKIRFRKKYNQTGLLLQVATAIG